MVDFYFTALSVAFTALRMRVYFFTAFSVAVTAVSVHVCFIYCT